MADDREFQPGGSVPPDPAPGAPDAAEPDAAAAPMSDESAPPAAADMPDVKRVSQRDRKTRMNAARRSLFASDWETADPEADRTSAPPLLPDQPAQVFESPGDAPPEPTPAAQEAQADPLALDAPFMPPEMRIEEALQAHAALKTDDPGTRPGVSAYTDADTESLDDRAQDDLAQDDIDAFIDELDSSLVRTIPPEAFQGETDSAQDDADQDDLDQNDLAQNDLDQDDIDAFIDELDSSLVRTLSPEDIARMARDARPQVREERFPPLPGEPAAARYVAPSEVPVLRARPQTPPLAKPTRAVREPIRDGGGRLPPDEPPLPPPPTRGSQNLITGILVVLALLVIGYILVIWRNPYSPLNPLAPFTPLPIVITATYTPTPLPSATLTPPPSSTPSPVPTASPTLEQSPTPAPPTPDASGSVNYPFRIQDGRALYLTNPDSRGGCNWASITGTVKTAEGEPLNNYRVRIIGTVAETQFDEEVLTGSAPGFGPGGFELQIGRESVDADFTIQLLDPEGVPVSSVFPFVTSSRCDWNVARLNFVRQ